MAVAFVAGRAGAGKTWRCLEAIRYRLRESAAEGNRLLLIVPEQASFQMERALVETPDIPGFTRCEVLSFQRLAYRIFAETGADPRRGDQTIGSLGRMMALRRLIRRERDRLRLLGRVADKPGLVTQLASAIDELMREAVEPATLATLADRCEAENPLGASKLADLARLYQAYLDYLVDDRLDPAQYLALAAERLAGCAWAHGAEVWVDGFAGFTGQEMHLLIELARHVARMEIALLVDPGASALTSDDLPPMTFSLFARTERTLVQLRQRLREAGIAVEEPIRLGAEGLPRFRSPVLAVIEESLFAERGGNRATQSTQNSQNRPAGSRSHTEGSGSRTGPVRVLELSDRRAEVEAVVAEIQRLTREADPPMRYRDMAVIVRDLGVYHDLLAAALASRGIPCFIDRRQPTSGHPLVELVRALLAIAADDCRLESVRHTLKSGLLPLDAGDADLLENYLIAHGIAGWSRWQEVWPYTRMFRHAGAEKGENPYVQRTLQKVNQLRTAWVAAVRPWVETTSAASENQQQVASVLQQQVASVLQQQVASVLHQQVGSVLHQQVGSGLQQQVGSVPHQQVGSGLEVGSVLEIGSVVAGTRRSGQACPGREWAQALASCLEAIDVGGRLEGWAEQAEADGASDLAQVHRQVWTDFADLLDEFVRALGDELMTLDEFRETVEAGLAAFDLGLAPPTLDQVLVGAIERSRHPAVRAVFLLGFDQAHFPMRRSEDPLLGDAEREALETLGAAVRPSRRRQLLDERMLAYIAMTRAGERLWISYARREADGQTLQASPFLAAVLAALPGLAVERVEDVGQSRVPDPLTRVGDLGSRLAAEFRYRSSVEEEPGGARRAVWNALYEAARHREEWQPTLRRTLAGLAYHNEARLREGLIEKALSSPLVVSVSRLERFAACHFAHYADYLLRLEPRVEAELASVDIGTLCHAILEKFIDGLAKAKRSLGTLEDAEIAEGLAEAAEHVIPTMSNEMLLADARHAYLVERSRGHVGRVTRWQRDAAKAGRFRPIAVEFPFGYAGRTGATVSLTTPRGRKLLLRGKIDRVDVADLGGELLGLVIDYKTTTQRKLEHAEMYHGLSLQLIGYLLALQQAGQSLTGRPIRPVAAVYLPVIEPYESLAHPDEESGPRYRWRGVMELPALDSLDRDARGEKKSAYFAAGLKKDGDPQVHSDLARSEELIAMMRHVGQQMGELADGIIDGRIEVNPYRLRRHMPCTWCDYRAVCRYEIETQPPRTFEPLRKTTVMERLREGESHG